MKNWKKIAMAAATLALSASLVFSATACSDSSGDDIDLDAYYDLSSEIYDEALGEFYEYYQAAKSNAKSTSERYALMALAEAKLMESAVMVPTTTSGGNYAISRAVPHTYSYVLWGNDGERYHQMLVANQFLTSEHREAVNEMYAEALSSGAEFDNGASAKAYSASVRAYLVEEGYTIKDSYTISYSSDPNTYDVLATSKAVDSEVLVNTYDGLVEYDELGNLQYALADSYSVSDDGLTYTFHIRSGDDTTYWYSTNDQSTPYAAVTADDFVAGFQHMLDAAGGLEYLVEGLIVGVDEYIAGTADFDEVGVKQVDENGKEDEDGEYVQYTLTEECSYFMTMLGYGVFAPMNRAYFVSLGGGFGDDYDASASNYTYGTSYTTILYCGPYFITNASSKSTIAFTANTNYWNYENINLKSITWLYNDGADTTKSYYDAIAGTIDGCSLNSDSLALAESQTSTDVDGNSGTYFDLFGYVSSTTATSYMAFYNLNRQSFSNYNDGAAASSQSEEDAARTNAAMNNVHFRRAISFAFDRGEYNAQVVGEDLKYTSLRNSYTPGTFVQLTEDVTITITSSSTGKSENVTFESGTYYGAIMQAQIDADEVKMTVWDPTADGGIGSSDGFDGWYNVDNAVEELEIAIAELEEAGVEVSPTNPIQIDYVCYASNNTYYSRGLSYKQALESALNGYVQVNLVRVSSEDDWYYSSYLCDAGYQCNYDMSDLSGWGPDYGDPSTYLDTMLPDGAGYMTMMLGLW